MPYLPHTILRFATAIAIVVLVPALRSDSTPTSPVPPPLPAASAATGASHPPAAIAGAVAAKRLASSYGKLPLSFEINQGQTNGTVQFLSRGAGYTLYLLPDEAVLSLQIPQTYRPGPPSLAGQPSRPQPSPSGQAVSAPDTLQIQLIGANQAAHVTGVDPLPGKSNYMVGGDPAKWHTGVPTYGKVRYHDIYPGVDLIFYGNQQGRLEHDFVIAPGADPGAIEINLCGRHEPLPDGKGGLALRTTAGAVTLLSPVVYQIVGGQRKMISATYRVARDKHIRFSLGSYDTTAPLVIDPVLEYSAVFGGSHPSQSNSIAVDGSGNAYVTGITESTNFPLVHPFQDSWSGLGTTAFVSKINPSGTALVYSTYFACTSNAGTHANGIAVDNSGRAYVVGYAGSGLPLKNAHQSTFGGETDAFVAVFSPAGDALVYSTYLGGYGSDMGYAIALDESDNAYITGLSGGGFPTLHSIEGHGSIFAAKFNSDGVLQYSSVFAQNPAYSEISTPNGIAVDTSGSAYIAGVTNSPDFPVSASAFQRTCPTSAICQFVAKLNPEGNGLDYSTYLGSNGVFFSVASVAVDSSGEAYIAGTTAQGFPVTSRAFQPTSSGFVQGYVAKLDASGSDLIWSTYLGAAGGNTYIGGLAIDKSRTVYVTGYTSSPNFPLKAPVQDYASSTIPGFQRFVTTLSGSLSSLVYYSTYFGGTGNNYGSGGIAVDKAFNVYLTGTSYGEIQVIPGALYINPSSSTNGDVFVSKLVIMDDLSLGLSASAGTVASEGYLTYSIAVTSKGPDFGTNVRVQDSLPAGTTFVRDTAGGGTCTAPAVGATGILSCSLPQLNKGSTWIVTLTVKVKAAAGSTLSNTATAASSMQDFVPRNNTGTLITKVD